MYSIRILTILKVVIFVLVVKMFYPPSLNSNRYFIPVFINTLEFKHHSFTILRFSFGTLLLHISCQLDERIAFDNDL